MLEFIPIWIWGILLALGALGLVFKNKLSDVVGSTGSVLGLKKTTTLLVVIGLAIFMGGFGVLTGWWAGMSPAAASISPAGVPIGTTFGEMTLKIHDGIVSYDVNANATEDTIDASDKFMTFYSVDSSIQEGEEYAFNITVGRSSIAEDSSAKVTCTLPDKDVSASEDCLAQKTAGKIDMDFTGGDNRDTGTHIGDNSVYTYLDFAEGDGSETLLVKFDQDESYHDAMTDLQDYVDITCVINSDSGSDQVVVRIYADS